METQVIQMGFTMEQRIRLGEYAQKLASQSNEILEMALEFEDIEQRKVFDIAHNLYSAAQSLLTIVK